MGDKVKNCAYLGKVAGTLWLAGVGTCVAEPLVQCQAASFEGVSVCEVDMASYAQLLGNGLQGCPAGVTSTGTAVLCEETFAAAVNDAKSYFQAVPRHSTPYLIKIDAGTYDFSSQTRPLGTRNGAIDVAGIAPKGDGCLSGNPAETGIVTLSGNPCLIFSGAGPDQTTLVTASGINGISGMNVSHLMFENMTMMQPNHSTTQGIYVSQATRTINGVDFPTLTLDIAAGFPTPLDLYLLNCTENEPHGCSGSGLSSVVNDMYMRAFTNSDAPQLIQSTSHQDSNAQYPWGFPSVDHVVQAAVRPTQPDAADFPNRWTITLSRPAKQRAIPSYYSGTTAGVANLICMKVDHANAFWFADNVYGGTDIIMNNIVWVGAARGTFRGVTASLTSGSLGAQVYNSSIERGPAVNGVVPCLATQSGGLQFGQPGDPPVYGNAVYGLSAQGTGDDTIAMFNDIGGTPGPHGSTYPQTVIRQSVVGNSFARDVLLVNTPKMSRLSGDSPVLVDNFTQAEIINKGNCDPLVLGAANCPVTYVGP